MGTKYEEYVYRTSILDEKYEKVKTRLEPKKDELEEMYKKAKSAYNDFARKCGVFVKEEDGKCSLYSRNNKEIDQETKTRVLDLYNKMKAIEETISEVNEELNKNYREYIIGITNVRRAIQLTPEDYLNNKIDGRIRWVDKDEINVMADLLNNFEFVMNLSDVPFTVRAAVVKKYDESGKTLSGIVDLNTGEEIIPVILANKDPEYLYEDLYYPRTSTAWKMKPNEVLESQYDKVIYSSVAIVSKDGKYGICDMHTGDIIIPCEYDLVSLPKLWEELDNRETSPDKESPYGEIHNTLLKEYSIVTRYGQVYFVTNDTRYIGGIGGGAEKGPYAVYSAISGKCIIPINMDLTYHGCELLYKKLGCPTEPLDPSTLDEARKGLDKSPIKK